MIRRIVDFAAAKIRRRGMSPDEARAYNRQALQAWFTHANNGTPIAMAAHRYNVEPGDVIAFEVLRKTYPDELQQHAPLLTTGKITPGYLLRKIGTGEQVSAMNRCRPYRPRRSGVEYLFPKRERV